MGFVLLAGLFEPGGVVELFERSGGASRVGPADALVGKRLADGNGTVGFDGLSAGDALIARGYLEGQPLEVRCRALADDEFSEIAQPPIGAVPQLQGTQEAPLPSEPPAPPDAILQEGVPAGLASS